MSKYQSYFQDAQAKYESLESFDIENAINNLDTVLHIYQTAPTSGNRKVVENTFAPIADYYLTLSEINTDLQTFLNKASVDVAASQEYLLNEERYDNRVHPEQSTRSREVMYGIVPELRTSALPYLLAASVFMALMTIFTIFQMIGITGQINLSTEMLSFFTPAIGSIPFYKRSWFFIGIGGVLIMAVITFASMYFRLKNRNNV
jgi:hypothetical protein